MSTFYKIFFTKSPLGMYWAFLEIMFLTVACNENPEKIEKDIYDKALLRHSNQKWENY